MRRRAFLLGSAASAAAAVLPAGAAPAPVLRAAPATAALGPEGYPGTPVWGYDGGVPGPVLRLARGARLRRTLENGLAQPTTVHWHGIRVENAMDGVPGLNQAAVPPGGTFLYDIAPPDAGTYWYHSHERSFEQVARGLYGALVVEEAEPPDVDRDEVLLIDDWRLTRVGAIEDSFGAMHDRAHAGRIGNWITVNGRGDWRLPVRAGERLRLRLANVANARTFDIGLRGLEGWVAALDGQPLDAPARAGRLTLAPAQRADLIVDVTAEAGGEALLISFERDGGYALASLPVSAGGARRDGPPGPLPPNPVADPGTLDDARPVELRMEGGAMGGLRAARADSELLDIRALAERGLAWSFNGVAGMPDAPLLTAGRGETVRLAMVNDTAWPHAMHLHGHHFRRIGPDGALGPLRDTELVARGETAEIAFVADNPGDWLLHCHMLEHAAAGMMTWLRVL